MSDWPNPFDKPVDLNNKEETPVDFTVDPPNPATAEITDAELKTAVDLDEPETIASIKEEEDRDKQKAKTLESIGKILKKFNGMESNIPVKHEYWDLIALYRSLNANP
jgi:hypothetical protein